MQTIAERGGANQQIPTGQIVAAKGQLVRSLVILQKGQVTVHSVEMSPVGQPITRPLYIVNAPAVVGVQSLFSGLRCAYQISTSQQSEVSVYPSNKEYLLKLIAAKPSIGVLALKSLYKDFTDLEAKLNATEQTQAQIEGFELGFSIALSTLLPDKFGDNATTSADFSDPLIPEAKARLNDFTERGGSIVAPLNVNFLRSAKDQIETVAEKQTDTSAVSLVRRLFSLPQDVLALIASRDPQLLYTAAENLADLTAHVNSGIEHELHAVQEFLQRLLIGDYAWLSKFALQAELMESNSHSAARADIIASCQYFLDGFTTLRDRLLSLAEIAYPPFAQNALQRIQKAATLKETVKPTATAVAPPTDDHGLAELVGSVDKILEWSEYPADKTTQFKKDWDTLKKFKNPLDASDDDIRKLRRRVNLQYWEIFERGILKHLRKRGQLPLFMRLFFDYGFMDETLLETEHLTTLAHASYGKGDPWLPVYTITEWLTAIYERKNTTSISEMGLTFFELLRQDNANRDKKWRKETDLPPDVNSPEARVKFEIKEMLQMNCRLCSGNISGHLNILTKHQITQTLSKVLVTKDTITQEIRKIVGTDFGAFHREVLYNNEAMRIQREFIQVQVMPNLVLVPSIGTVVQFWQDREGNDRLSRGRLFAPIMVTAEIATMLLRAVGTYRWEMCKTTMGPDWNNISVSSLTADYTDYVQFYYKSKELSEEIKEKLSEDFKRFRDDRARFVNDYTIYMRFESDGSQRMNRVARKIFTKHVPFSKNIRERLLKLPSYTDVVQKSINIRKRKANELTPRYTKYERENKSLPKELVETRKFYNMEY